MANAERISGKTILVTGPAGQIALPLARRLAEDNEVWGIARFSDSKSRERAENAGVRTRVVDLEAPDWSSLPERFDYVLHLAAAIIPGNDFDKALRINAEGTGKLMHRFRNADALLCMSTCGVYESPEDGERPVVESDPLGGSHQPYAPTYCISKIAQEAVARYAAQEYGLRTTIARMNAAYGDNGGLPAMLVHPVLEGNPVPLLAGHSICSPIHEDDIFDHTPGLLAAASVPATITNWGGDEPVDLGDMVRYIGKLLGREGRTVESPDGIHQYRLDATRRRELAGPCRVSWKEGVRRMLAARHPELPLAD